MKILTIHNFHRSGSASGDDKVFINEAQLLENRGNTVIRYTVSNDEFDSSGVLGKLKLAFCMLWSQRSYRTVKNLIRMHHPDVVHVHTFFPLLSPSILYAAKKCRVPVVATLHDTRFICPNSTSLRDGKICNKCKDGRYSRMCRYKCFKGSRIQSLWVGLIFKCHRIWRTFYKQIDKYICLNNVQIELLESAGFDRNRIVKKYNFFPENSTASLTKEERSSLPDHYVVFYGRIGEEKGVRQLMQIWDKLSIPLVIIGGGPLEEEVRDWSRLRSNVTYLGYTEHSKCLSIVRDSEFVVFPSIWYEGCSMVEIETMSMGRGIVAFDIGFSSEAITDRINGIKVPLGDIVAFREAVEALWKDLQLCRIIGHNARTEYEKKYKIDDNYEQLMAIYKGVLL